MWENGDNEWAFPLESNQFFGAGLLLKCTIATGLTKETSLVSEPNSADRYINS